MGTDNAEESNKRPLVFAYYVTGHGFGHATRVVEVPLSSFFSFSSLFSLKMWSWEYPYLCIFPEMDYLLINWVVLDFLLRMNFYWSSISVFWSKGLWSYWDPRNNHLHVIFHYFDHWLKWRWKNNWFWLLFLFGWFFVSKIGQLGCCFLWSWIFLQGTELRTILLMISLLWWST